MSIFRFAIHEMHHQMIEMLFGGVFLSNRKFLRTRICAENVTNIFYPTRKTSFADFSCGSSNVNVLRMEDYNGIQISKTRRCRMHM